MKNFLFLIVVLPLALFSQKKIDPSSSITIQGAVKQALQISIEDLKKYPAQKAGKGKLNIYSHDGTLRSTMKGLLGIPIKTLLKKVEFAVDSPKDLSQFYLVFEATDGYQALYSWNEIFNTPVGDQVYILTKADGMGLDAMEQRIALVSMSDLRTGRRYVKGLTAINVRRL
ncbi:MAG TPA: hypothetical protein PLC89_12440 [Haliscomenobacter sp.]|uniref:hypothetical protein n=1 Tax=Haliscomenobacter sp. TaxID=2717303 RepID=UPI002B8605DC|nr:hypothetical protein [Haliscomenobacter sp.]HOY18105.1 hypothetical protein [Haliscomenobacter sp.]HPH19298.1 hypothetical protein [Haliscomenobacter sp.]